MAQKKYLDDSGECLHSLSSSVITADSVTEVEL